VIVDGDVPKLDGVDVMSDDGEIVVEKQMTDHSIDLIVRTEDNTTGQIVLKASDESSAFVVYFDEDEIGWWGDPGSGGEGTFFVPIAITAGLDESHTIRVEDEAGFISEYTLRLRVTNMAGDLPPIIENVLLKLNGYEIRATDGGTYTATVGTIPAEAVLTFSAHDDQGIDSIIVKVNGEQVADGSPVTLSLLDGENIIEITAVDSAGQKTTFTFTLKLAKEETTGMVFDLELSAGTNYFGIPILVDKTMGEILPGVDVYRRSGSSWILANDEKPEAFAVYKATLSRATTLELLGDVYSQSKLSIPANVSTYMSIPQTDAIDVEELFGDAIVSLKVVDVGGVARDVKSGTMEPGKAYIVILNKSMTISLPAEY